MPVGLLRLKNPQCSDWRMPVFFTPFFYFLSDISLEHSACFSYSQGKEAAMFEQIKRHPIQIAAHFDFSLVLTYSVESRAVLPLLPPGLTPDEKDGQAFLAVAMVQTRKLRPAFLPAWTGKDFFLTGYRIFTRMKTAEGRNLRGLRILRSDADRPSMVFFGNMLTHYNYHRVIVDCERQERLLNVKVRSDSGQTDLSVQARIVDRPLLPLNSPFKTWREARMFAGPLPFTFDYESATDSIVIIEGKRENWNPLPVEVSVAYAKFFDGVFPDETPRLASAFLVENVPYTWKAGVLEKPA